MQSKDFEGLTCDVALYYFSLGADNFSLDEMKTMKTLLETRGTPLGLTDNDLQECWEVYVYLSHYSKLLWRLNPEALPANFLGNHSFVREWDRSLHEYNLTILNNQWVIKVFQGADTGEDVWGSYRKLYKDYQRLTGGKVYFCVDMERKIEGLEDVYIDTDKYLNNKDFTHDFIDFYENAVFYELEDVMDWYEKVHVNLLNTSKSKSPFNLGFEAPEGFMEGLNKYTSLVSGHDWGLEW